MSLIDYRKKPSHLPPIASQSKSYVIRKSARVQRATRNSQAEIRNVKSLSPQKVTARSKQETPQLFFTLQDIQLGKCLGRGKGGRVVIGSTSFKDFAIKIISKQLYKYASNEAMILEQLNSPYIIKFTGTLEDEENMYLILELVKGFDLFHSMRKKRLRANDVVSIAAKVFLALEACHEAGIVYRDLKPENVMIGDDGKLKLIDFGLSKKIDNERTSTVCGSPEYMAPEVIRKTAYSYSVDYWAIGVLIYEMFCGHPPFQGESYPEICRCILGGHFEFTRTVDVYGKDIVRRLLHIEPTYRLGNQNKDEVTNHRFFKDVDWGGMRDEGLYMG